MFSTMEIEEDIESELSGIFRVKLVAKNIVLGPPGTHFMHMKVKAINYQGNFRNAFSFFNHFFNNRVWVFALNFAPTSYFKISNAPGNI